MPESGSFIFGGTVTSPLGELEGSVMGLTGINWSVRVMWTNGRGGKGGVGSERWQRGGREGGAPQL